jgi:hypothetical protein
MVRPSLKKPNQLKNPARHICNPSHSGGRDQEDHGLKYASTDTQ